MLYLHQINRACYKTQNGNGNGMKQNGGNEIHITKADLLLFLSWRIDQI